MPTLYDDEFTKRRAEEPKDSSPDQEQDSSTGPEASPGTSADKEPDLRAAEESPTPGRMADKAEEPEAVRLGGGFYKPDVKKQVIGQTRKLLSSRNKLLAGAAGGLAIVLLIFIIYIVGTLKVAHFAEIVSASGYARLNSILKERTAQNMFDVAIADGKPVVGAGKSKLWDRVRGIDPQKDLVRLGQEGRFKFNFEGGRESAFSLRKADKFQGVTIDGETIRLDEITQDKFGKNSYYTLVDPTKKAAVRAEFTSRVQNAVNEKFHLESRHVRSAANKVIMDNVGFSFSRWSQKGRQYIGKDSVTATIDNAIEGEEQTQKNIPRIDTGIASIDETVEEMRKSETLRKFMFENNGKMDFDQYLKDAFVRNQSIAFKTADIAGKVGQGTMLLSLSCLTNVSFNRINETDRRNQLQAERVALQLMAASSQARAGDTTAGALGAANKSYDGAEQSPRYQKMTGSKKVVVPENFISPRVRNNFGTDFINLIDTVTSPSSYVPGSFILPESIKDDADAKFCSTLLSPEGTIVAVVGEIGAQAAICFFTLCTGTAATEAGANVAIRGLAQALKQGFTVTAKGLASKETVGIIAAFTAYSTGLEVLVGQLSGQAFSSTATGANRVEQDFVGTEAVQNHQMRMTMRGRPLSAAEKSQLDSVNQTGVRAAYMSKGGFARYFGASNPYSLTGKIIASSPGNGGSASIKLRDGLTGLGTAILSPANYFSAFAPQKAQAAEEEADGVESQLGWGFSLDEIKKMRTNPSFGIAENSTIIEPRLAELDSKYAECYVIADQYDADELVKNNPNCSIQSLSAEDALRWRIYTGLDSYFAADQEDGLKEVTISSEDDAFSNNQDNEQETVPGDSCYVVTKQRGSRTEGWMFHKSPTQTYAFENSPAGIQFAARKGHDSIDIDVRLTKDGIPVATHWERPMVQDGFYDPAGRIPQNTTVQDMTFEEISRLRNRDGQSQILSIDQIAPILAENNMNLSLELKVANLVGKLPQITASLNTHKVKAIIKADATKTPLEKALASARNYGYWTRGTERSQDWAPPGPSCK